MEYRGFGPDLFVPRLPLVPSDRKPRLQLSPRADRAFAEVVGRVGRDARTPLDLERALRTEYPGARVQPSAVSDLNVWYVYRDGRWHE